MRTSIVLQAIADKLWGMKFASYRSFLASVGVILSCWHYSSSISSSFFFFLAGWLLLFCRSSPLVACECVLTSLLSRGIRKPSKSEAGLHQKHLFVSFLNVRLFFCLLWRNRRMFVIRLTWDVYAVTLVGQAASTDIPWNEPRG